MTQLQITEAPIKERITTKDFLTDIWLAFFSQVSSALAGKWLYVQHTPTVSGLSGQTETNVVLMYRGALVKIDYHWEGSLVTSGATITLPFNVKKSNLIIHYNTGSWEIASIVVEDNTITLPDVSASQITITGTLIKQGSYKTKG